MPRRQTIFRTINTQSFSDMGKEPIRIGQLLRAAQTTENPREKGLFSNIPDHQSTMFFHLKRTNGEL